MLNTTNKVAGDILGTAVSIDKRAAAIDDKLALLANALGAKR
jgi:hypothetical protein